MPGFILRHQNYIPIYDRECTKGLNVFLKSHLNFCKPLKSRYFIKISFDNSDVRIRKCLIIFFLSLSVSILRCKKSGRGCVPPTPPGSASPTIQMPSQQDYVLVSNGVISGLCHMLRLFWAVT